MSVKEFVQDVRQLGLNEALDHQFEKLRFLEVTVVRPDGSILSRGLLTSLRDRGDHISYWIKERASYGYVHSGADLGDYRIMTTRGKDITPQLPEGRQAR